jgi:hypothetical protein
VSARVFVPLVGADGMAEQLFEAIASDVPPEPHPAKLVPQIAELFDFGLYQMGQLAREAAIRFVDARRRLVWLGQRNARARPWFLRISDLQVGRLSDDNARSAGLGLALAAILQAFGRDAETVFATGQIVLPTASAASSIAIAPVGGLHAKLTLIADAIHRHRAALRGRRVVVALPATTLEGAKTKDAEAAILGRLSREAEEAGLRFEVLFLDSLDEIEAAFGPLRLTELLTRPRAVTLVSILVLLIGVAAFWLALAHAPIRLAWAPVEIAGAGAEPAASSDPLPQRARYDAASDKLRILPRCYDEQRQPMLVGGETLLMRATMRDGLPFASRVRPPHMFIASVSRSADPVILDANLFRRASGNATTEGDESIVTAIPIEPVEDEIRLFVVATRDPTVQPSALIDDLRKRLSGLSGPSVLATTASFLADRLGSTIDYQFKVTNDAKLCAS